jgi:hypothetical protein
MKDKSIIGTAAKALLLLALFSCEKFPASDQEADPTPVPLEELAQIFSSLPLEKEHLDEVHTAVSASLGNGYDEEYTMADLFTSPGAGVGERSAGTKSAAERWPRPLRTLLEDYLEQSYATRAGGSPASASEYIAALTQSDLQIYWPYSEDWDGRSLPVVTFDPGGEMTANIGYEMRADGSVKEVVVNEEMAMERPVWVINRNDDSGYKTIEMLRREDPDWGSGGTVVVRKQTKSPSDTRTLILEELELMKNKDSWFAGGNEMVFKAGGVENFNASTEAEMRLYSPSVTDFMISVKRSQVRQKIPVRAVLISEWTEDLQSLAFLVTEDDGGTQVTWKCTAKVTVKSKSFGIDIEIPLNSRDDIIWRGQLTRNYLEKNNGLEGQFGDVWLTFGFI